MKKILPFALLSASVLTAAVPGLAASTPPTPPASAAQPGPSGSTPGWNGMFGGGMMGGGMMGMMMGGGMMGMMRGGPGGMMGVALANAPGPRVPLSEEKTLATAVPAGATVNRAGNAIAFSTRHVRLTMVSDSANVAGVNRMFFEIAGLRNPAVTVPAGATVTVQFVNADGDEAHLLAFSAAAPPFPFMAMMDAWPAFPGAEAPPSAIPRPPDCIAPPSPSWLRSPVATPISALWQGMRSRACSAALSSPRRQPDRSWKGRSEEPARNRGA